LHQVILHVETVWGSLLLGRSSYGIMIQFRLNRPALHVRGLRTKIEWSSVDIMTQSRYPMVQNFLPIWNDLQVQVWSLPCFNHFQLASWCSRGLYPVWPILRSEDLSQGGAVVLNSTTRWHLNLLKWGSGEVSMGISSNYYDYTTENKCSCLVQQNSICNKWISNYGFIEVHLKPTWSVLSKCFETPVVQNSGHSLVFSNGHTWVWASLIEARRWKNKNFKDTGWNSTTKN
jgi:hypothetical protein